MAAYLSSYRPLCRNLAGRAAIKTYCIPPFVDASCRREPDFQSAHPSISALCHGEQFAPRLRENDHIVYVTHKLGNHWNLVAVIRVMKLFESHIDAARWYREQGLSLPSNCMVEGNPPLPLDQTDRHRKALKAWDRLYAGRARRCGVFLACEPIFLELHNPPVITREQMFKIFGRIPRPRTPPKISEQEYDALLNATRKERLTPHVG